jgi:hypothetical protein
MMPMGATMTIDSDINSNDYLGNGATTVFQYEFKIFADTDLLVTTQDLAGSTSTLALNTDYTVTGALEDDGGSITLTTALPGDGTAQNSHKLNITRAIPALQPADFTSQGTVRANIIERALDRCVMLIQQLIGKLNRSISVPITDTGASLTLPPASERALKTLAFDADGNVIAGQSLSGGVVSSAMEPVVTAASLALGRTAFGLERPKRINALTEGWDNTGVADCYAAVQAVINAADDNGLVIEFPQGYYYLSAGLNIDNKPITLIGDGFRPYVSDVRGSTQWLQSNSPTFGTVLFFANTSGACIDATSGTPYTHMVKMRDLAIVGSGNASVSGVRIASAGLAAVLCDLDNVGIHNCGAGLVGFAVYDSTFKNLDIRGCDTGISLNGSNQNVFINTQISGCVTAIAMDSCDTIQFYGGAVQGATTRAVLMSTCQNCLVEGIYFENTNITDKDIYITGGANCGLRHCHHSSNATYGGITIFSGTKHFLHHTREASGKVLIAAGSDNADIFECTLLEITDLGTYTAITNVIGTGLPNTIQTQGGIVLGGGSPASAVPGQYIGFASGAPATGTYARGSIVFNSLASLGAPSCWVCTAGGTPGTWRAQANII